MSFLNIIDYVCLRFSYPKSKISHPKTLRIPKFQSDTWFHFQYDIFFEIYLWDKQQNVTKLIPFLAKAAREGQ